MHIQKPSVFPSNSSTPLKSRGLTIRTAASLEAEAVAMLARQTARLARSTAQRRSFSIVGGSQKKVVADQKLFADKSVPTHERRASDKALTTALFVGLGVGFVQFAFGEVSMTLGKK